MQKNFIKILLPSLIMLISFSSVATREISINEGNFQKTPIAINQFEAINSDQRKIADNLVEVIRNDLASSNFFRVIPESAFIDNKIGASVIPDFMSWRRINAQLLLNGTISQKGSKISINFIIWDIALDRQILRSTLEVPSNLWRRSAHKIADIIYERVTGEKGYFDTRIAFVSESGPLKNRNKRLAIIDFDGENFRYVTTGAKMALTPRFSPDVNKLLFLSYNNDTPKVYIKDLNTKREKLLGDFPGMSFAPRFSPDGKRAVFCIAKNGATNIYEMNLSSKKIRQLTSGYDINTSPSYSPNGEYIVFNSNRSGSRQIYLMKSDGSDVRRISFGSGSYATPVWSPTSNDIAFTKISPEGFYIGVMKTDGSEERLIADGYLVEGPTWAPNGKLIMFAKEFPSGENRANMSKLYVVDISGNHLQRINTPEDASDPEWSSNLD